MQEISTAWTIHHNYTFLGLSMQSDATYVLEIAEIEKILKQLDVVDHRDQGDIRLCLTGSTLQFTRLLRKKELVTTEAVVTGCLPFPLQIKWKRLKHLMSGHSDKVRIVLRMNDKGLGDLRVDNMLVEFELLTKQLSLPLGHTSAAEDTEQKLIDRIEKLDIENSLLGPINIEVLASRYERDQELIQLIKRLRGSRCQICDFSFKTTSGENYSECHHLEHLAKSGLDVSKNILVLCANHHRQFHFGLIQVVSHAKNNIEVSIDGVLYRCNL